MLISKISDKLKFSFFSERGVEKRGKDKGTSNLSPQDGYLRVGWWCG